MDGKGYTLSPSFVFTIVPLKGVRVEGTEPTSGMTRSPAQAVSRGEWAIELFAGFHTVHFRRQERILLSDLRQRTPAPCRADSAA
jgi:hypothetical protein